MGNSKNLLFISAIGLCLGAILPWITMTSILGQQSITGMDGDGVFSGGIGVILLLIGATSKGEMNRQAGGFTLALSAIALLVIVPIYGRVSEAILSADMAIVSYGTGLHLSLLGAVIGIVAGGSILRNTQSEQSVEKAFE